LNAAWSGRRLEYVYLKRLVRGIGALRKVAGSLRVPVTYRVDTLRRTL
jgi:hypothetical protein